MLTLTKPGAIENPKYPEGRTIKEATAAGDFYRLEHADGRRCVECPGCGTPEECLAAARSYGFVAPGETLTVLRHLPNSTIGAAVLETVGTITNEA